MLFIHIFVFTDNLNIIMNRKTLYILLFFVIVAHFVSRSQPVFRNLSYGLTYERGNLIPGDKYGKDLIKGNNYSSYAFHVSYRADSLRATPSDLSFGYPVIEGGILVSDYSRSPLYHPSSSTSGNIGYMIGLYGKFCRDLFNTGSFRMGYTIANGIGVSTRPYSYPDNQANEFIGSRFSIYFSTDLYAAYRFHPRFEVMLSGGLKHYSNSALGRPNKGANTLGMALGMRYYPSADVTPRYKVYNPSSSPLRRLELDLNAGCNLHTMIEGWYYFLGDPSTRPSRFQVHPSFAASVSAMYRYHIKFSSGIGIDYIRPSYVSESTRLDTAMGGKNQTYSPHILGVSLKHEIHYRQLSLSVGLGYYLHRELGHFDRLMSKPYYETIGLRYYIPHTPLYVSYHVLAHLFRADSMQFGIGIRQPLAFL